MHKQPMPPGWLLIAGMLFFAISTLQLRADEVATEITPAEPASPATAPPNPVQWLVDYGLAYGERVTDPRETDADYVLVWMDAAARMSPALAEAHLWRYDLLSRLNRPSDARTALADYCRAAPRDLPAAFNLLEIDFAAARNVEERIAICRQRLDQPGIAPELASDLHRRLADIALARGDLDTARAEAQRAIGIIPLNLAAQRLLATADDRLADPLTRVHLLVVELSVNPANADARRRMADLLGALGMSSEALAWYAHTQDALIRQNPDRAMPADLTLAVAHCRAESGDVDGALADCQRVLAADPANIPAALQSIVIARDAGRDDLAALQTETLAARLRELEPQATSRRDAALCGQIAWFHLDIAYDPHRALEFARRTAEYAPDQPAAAALVGRALLETDQTIEAIAKLEPVARGDQRAALALATALRSQDRGGEATAVLQQAARLRFAGSDFRKIRGVLRELRADAPTLPDRDAVRAALAGLTPGLLNFDAQPAEAVRYEVRLAATEFPLTAPIRAEISLRNTAAYPLTIGENRMLPAQVAVSVRRTGDPASERLGYLTLDLYEHYLLPPGGRTARVVRLDTVPAQALLFRNPTRALDLEFTITPAPQLTASGALTSRLTGVPPVIRRCARLPVNASADGQSRLAAQLRTGREPERLAAVEIILSLIYEQHAAEAGGAQSQSPSAARVDPAQLLRLLRLGLRDTSPVVRARAAGALTYLPLDADTIAEVSPLLSDAHFLPRLMACELFAGKQGEVFLPVLNRLRTDPDPLVARLAGLYAEQLTPAPAE